MSVETRYYMIFTARTSLIVHALRLLILAERARKLPSSTTEDRLTYVVKVPRTLTPCTVAMGQFSVMKIAVALLAFMFLVADAFVTPSAFTGKGVSSGPRAGATARAAGAMRSRPTMNVIDVRGVELWLCQRGAVCSPSLYICVSYVAL